MLGSIFGMMNVFSRPSGGLLSDWVASRYGMRGRLWALWVVQTLAGVCCIVMGLMSHSLQGTMGILIVFSLFCQMSCGLSFGVVVRCCGRWSCWCRCVMLPLRRSLSLAPAPRGGPPASPARLLPSPSPLRPTHLLPHTHPSILQPFVSKRATGLVSGFVGAGGNMGGAVTQAIFFTYAPYAMDKAFVYMGIMAVVSIEKGGGEGRRGGGGVC